MKWPRIVLRRVVHHCAQVCDYFLPPEDSALSEVLEGNQLRHRHCLRCPSPVFLVAARLIAAQRHASGDCYMDEHGVVKWCCFCPTAVIHGSADSCAEPCAEPCCEP
jgi:hypothetical protein